MASGADQTRIMAEPVPVRAAASVILWRQGASGAEVLMGQRGHSAVFMPAKFVFPGGAVDQGDHAEGHLAPDCEARLGLLCPAEAPGATALAGCALRELIEETGLCLAPGAPLLFMFRAITPAGSARRFDARFFLADARGLIGDAEDFSAATDELSHLHWIGLAEARGLDLPFITEVVLAEVGGILRGHAQPGVPFFDNSGPDPLFRRLV